MKKLKTVKPLRNKQQHVRPVRAHVGKPKTLHSIALHHSLSSGHHPKPPKPVQPKKK